MGKKGVSRLSGNITPIVGEKNIYNIVDWYPDTPISQRNPAKVTWELFKKRRNGKFTTTKIKKLGKSDFTFGEMAIGETYRLEGYLYGPEGGGLIINPKPSKIPKIDKVDLLYVDDTNAKVFSFTELLRARAHCTNMFGKELLFTLWEDDAKDEGHNPKNKIIESKKKKVNQNGLATVEFHLTKVLMKKALEGEADTKQVEFYVTVEYYAHKKHPTNNVNINTPEGVYIGKPKSPPPPPTSQPKAKDSPAEKKGKSKKEEKGIIETAREKATDIIGGVVDRAKEIFDWKEGTATVKRDQPKTQPKQDNGKAATNIGNQPNTNTSTCLCKEIYKDLIWGEKVSCDFRKKVVEISQLLWPNNHMAMANGLMAVMNVETDGSFKAHQIMGKPLGDVNSITKDDFWLIKKDGTKTSRAVGLIQFTQPALELIGEFTAGTGYDKLHEVKLRFAKMGEINQLNCVKDYIKKQPKYSQKNTPEDIYLLVFGPEGVGKSDGFVLYEQGKDAEKYRQNKSVDEENNNDKKIQRSEILGRYNISYTQGSGNKPKTFNCKNILSTPHISSPKKIKWHDPVDNPMLCLYTQNGNYRPRYNVFGTVRKERKNHNHQGIDFLALPDSNVYACVDAYIEFISVQTGYGNVVCLKVKDPKEFLKRRREFNLQYSNMGEIQTGTGFSFDGDFYLFYAHLKEVDKSLHGKKEVTCGTVIGKNGTSGYGSTKDPHLHFEIRSSITGGGLTNRCHPGIFVYYKDENTMSQKEKDYQKEISQKYWD